MLAYWPVPPEDVWLDTPTGRTHLRFRSPTLVVIGAQEKIYDASAALARAEARIPGVTTVTIPDASHDLMFTQPARVSEALRAFLSDAG
jgi:pimeloyl-ACP methyl ester carboxylesterase